MKDLTGYGRNEFPPRDAEASQVTSSLRFEPIQSDQVSSVTRINEDALLQAAAKYVVPITRGRIPQMSITSDEA